MGADGSTAPGMEETEPEERSLLALLKVWDYIDDDGEGEGRENSDYDSDLQEVGWGGGEGEEMEP